MKADCFEKSLTNSTETYHKILRSLGTRLYKLYRANSSKAAILFLQTVLMPWGVYLDYLKNHNMNYGSAGGVIIEWYFFHIINEAIRIEKNNGLEVQNPGVVPFKWKKSGIPEVKVDIALWLRKSNGKNRVLLYCLEIKRNFEDGFEKYYGEQSIIYHNRIKIVKRFKYHYVAFSLPPAFIKERAARQLNTLKRRGQLWCFPFNKDAIELNDDNVLRARKLLESLYGPIIKSTYLNK